MGDLSREEFLTHIGLVRDDIAQVDARLDALNGRTRQAEQKIVRLDERLRQKNPRWPMIGGVSGVVAVIAEVVKAYWR